MAAQWRIRHKLLLGLGLVVVAMALVLGGSVRGLWGYFLTTVSIRAKLVELKAAEEFRDAITSLVSPSTLAELAQEPFQVDDLTRKPSQLLDEYERQLKDNVAEGRNLGDSTLQLDLIGVLRTDLVEFREAIYAAPPRMLRPGEAPAAHPGDNAEAKPDPVANTVTKLRRDTRDLRDSINDDLDKELRKTHRHYQVSFWIIAPSSALAVIVLACLLTSFYAWIFNPIRDLGAGVVRVAQGDFAHRIEVHSGDEMEDLGHAFNDMTGRLQNLYNDLARQVNERSRQLVRSERLASVGFLAAGVAHEINNPLASIAFCSEALEARLGELLRTARAAGRGEDGEVFTKYLKMIQEEAFRCKNITERLLEFSRTGERRREPTDLGVLVQSVLDLTQHLQHCRGKGMQLKINADRVPGGKILAAVNSEEIKSVVLNLVVNALDSMDEGGQLTISVSQKDQMAELRFTDTGCGMSQEVLENIFEPFFTRSRGGKGTGLGLTISHRIVTQHDGELEAVSAGPGRGSTFIVRLPVEPAAAVDISRPRLAAGVLQAA